MSSSDLSRTLAQLLLIGFEGSALPAEVAAALNEERLGGTILFRRNIESVEQVAELNARTHEASRGFVPLIAVDQEGGRVQRLKEPLTVLPPMQTVASCRDADLVAKLGEAVGDELRALGFNLDFAPCADINSNPDNPIIGDRAFGTTPEEVSRYAGAFAAGLTIAGVIPCAKHFPGHGDTLLDSHLDLPVLTLTREELDRRELAPFRSLVRAKIPMIMTAHILFPELDAAHPATLSAHTISELLRLEMGFDGVVISDDLDMKAVADRYETREMIDLGLRAGIDIFLICRDPERWQHAEEALHELWHRDAMQRGRMQQAAARVQRLRQDWLHPWSPPADLRAQLGTADHRQLVRTILERATALS